jgi:hypothetical protein
VQDCTGDGVVDALDDLNGDGRRGDVLDCQIAAVLALNASLRTAVGSAQRIEVGLTAFGTTAATAQMTRDDPAALFVPPGLTDRAEPAVARDPAPGGSADPSGRGGLSTTGGALGWTAAAAVALLLAGATARVLFRRRTGADAPAGGS